MPAFVILSEAKNLMDSGALTPQRFFGWRLRMTLSDSLIMGIWIYSSGYGQGELKRKRPQSFLRLKGVFCLSVSEHGKKSHK